MTVRVDSYVQFGPHQSASDITSTSGTKRFLRPREKIQLHGAKYARLPRPYQTGDGSKVSDLQGAQDTGTLPTFPFFVQGLSGGGAGDEVDSSTLDTPLDELLKLAFGGSTTNQTGATTHESDAGTGAQVIMDANIVSTGVAAWLIRGATEQIAQPRFQLSASSATATLCRALTTRDGTADTPVEDRTASAGRVYQVSTNAPDRTPQFIDAEQSAFQRDVYRGVYVSRVVFTITPGQLLTADFDFVYSAADFAASVQTPSYSAATGGSEIKCWSSRGWFGATLVMPKAVTITVENTLEPRESQGGPQGNYGWAVVDNNVTFETTLHMGSLTLEQARSYVTTLQGQNTLDLLFSAGASVAGSVPVGAAAAFRLPAADVDAEVIADGAKHAIKVMGKGTGTTPLQMAVF